MSIPSSKLQRAAVEPRPLAPSPLPAARSRYSPATAGQARGTPAPQDARSRRRELQVTASAANRLPGAEPHALKARLDALRARFDHPGPGDSVATLDAELKAWAQDADSATGRGVTGYEAFFEDWSRLDTELQQAAKAVATAGARHPAAAGGQAPQPQAGPDRPAAMPLATRQQLKGVAQISFMPAHRGEPVAASSAFRDYYAVKFDAAKDLDWALAQTRREVDLLERPPAQGRAPDPLRPAHVVRFNHLAAQANRADPKHHAVMAGARLKDAQEGLPADSPVRRLADAEADLHSHAAKARAFARLPHGKAMQQAAMDGFVARRIASDKHAAAQASIIETVASPRALRPARLGEMQALAKAEAAELVARRDSLLGLAGEIRQAIDAPGVKADARKEGELLLADVKRLLQAVDEENGVYRNFLDLMNLAASDPQRCIDSVEQNIARDAMHPVG